MVTAFAVVVFALVATVGIGLASGLRPVVLQTGSMGDTAPAGSLVVVEPVDGSSIDVGDIVVMRTPGQLPVTHRVVAIDDTEVGPVASTQGDANEFVDPAPYALTGEQLVAKWIVPGAGAWLERLQEPAFWVAVGALVVVAFALSSLRRLLPARSARRTSGAGAADPTRRRRRVKVGVGVLAVASLVSVGLVLSLYSSSAQVASNVFGTSDCFSVDIASIQRGTTVHTTNGTVSEPITAVDTSRAFVVASVRSAGTEIADASAQVVLAGPTAVDITRATDAGAPPAVTVDWTVVEYACGITVQRGITAGTGTDQIDVTIAAVEASSSFVLLNSLAPATAASFTPDDLARPLLTTSTNLSIAVDPGAVITPDRTFAWQVVSFDDADDAAVQQVSATMAPGTASVDVTLPTVVDTRSTFVVTSITSASTGPDIGSRLVRATLVDGDTVRVDRTATTGSVDVFVQAVTLGGGATVQHGTVDLNATVATRTVDVSQVDTTRSSVMSTVAVPGPMAGGNTTHSASTLVGEASATFALTSPDTVEITRGATASDASFGWQVVEWTGPTWWNGDWGHRQRVDVAASTAAAPDGYTVPVTIDHAAFVEAGISLANGDDVRVLRFDGTTWIELDRVLADGSTWNSATTTIEFRTTDPIAANTTATYWIHLDNPAAGAPPADPEQVYLLVEDFESGTLGDFEDRTGNTGWYSADPWMRTVELTVPAGAVSTDLTDFPLLVRLTLPDLGAMAQPDGSDIRFGPGFGSTRYDHEIEHFDPATGELVAWVRVPLITAATDNWVHLHYGAGNAPNQEQAAGVWGDDTVGIWHLDRDPSGSAPQLDDVSRAGNDGLSVGSMDAADLVTAQIGDGIDVDGVDDALVAAPGTLGDRSTFTVGAWVRPDAIAATSTVIANAVDTTERRFDLTITPAGEARARLLLASGEVVATTAAGAVPTGGWTHLAARWDGTTLDVFVDGVGAATVAATGPAATTAPMPITIGNVATQDAPFDGVIDEVRIEHTAHTTPWIAATVQNRVAPTFVQVGPTGIGEMFEQGPWGARKPITVDADQVAADLVDHTLLVEFSDAELAAATQACGCDIVFTAADGVTRLDHVIEAYDPGTGAVTAWVSVPLLSSTTDTGLFVYYANPTAVDQSDAAAVFGPDADLQILAVP